MSLTVLSDYALFDGFTEYLAPSVWFTWLIKWQPFKQPPCMPSILNLDLHPIWGMCIWATSWENLFMLYVNNKGADQPVHPPSLISAFVVRCLDSIIPLLAIAQISRLWLVSVAEQAWLSLTWLQTPKTGFLVTRLIWSGSLSVQWQWRSISLAEQLATGSQVWICGRLESTNLNGTSVHRAFYGHEMDKIQL